MTLESLAELLAASGGITDDLVTSCVWSDAMVDASGIEVRDVPLVTVGGGIGSFAMLDVLRIAGVSPEYLAAIGPYVDAYTSLRSLLINSQISDDDRIRSGSSDRMDNIWGWPGYGMHEAIKHKSLSRLVHLATEPVLAEYYTPKAGDVYALMDQEAERISWYKMFICGRVPLVRRRFEGGYFVLVVPPDGSSPSGVGIIRARYVHLSVGASSVHLLEDFKEYRESTGDLEHVVNVYEPHEHVYEELVKRPGSRVLVRGSASSSMQVLQRLIHDRDVHGTDVEIYHLFRNYVDGPQGPYTFRIPGGDGFSYQPFTAAKAAFGGQYQGTYRSMDDDEMRSALAAALVSTAVPRRSSWQRMLARGRKEGWYHVIKGSADGLRSGHNGAVIATVKSGNEDDGDVGDVGHLRSGHADVGHAQEIGATTGLSGSDEAFRSSVLLGGKDTVDLEVDFVIDATGVDANLRDHEVLADLVDCGGALLNAAGQLAVNCNFEVEGVRNGDGRIFASGFPVLGNPYVIPMYSFWGYQYVAWLVHNALASEGFCNRIGLRRSINQWWRKQRGLPP